MTEAWEKLIEPHQSFARGVFFDIQQMDTGLMQREKIFYSVLVREHKVPRG